VCSFQILIILCVLLFCYYAAQQEFDDLQAELTAQQQQHELALQQSAAAADALRQELSAATASTQVGVTLLLLHCRVVCLHPYNRRFTHKSDSLNSNMMHSIWYACDNVQ
jgi:heme/copper-type cytochrome/quinol oxidase subunit 2